MIGGNVVLLTASTECESINGDLVPQVGVLKFFLQAAVGLAYLFLLQYAWIFMGFNLRISPHIKVARASLRDAATTTAAAAAIDCSHHQ